MSCCTPNAWPRSRADYPERWQPVGVHPDVDRAPWTPEPDDTDQGVYYCPSCGDLWTLWRDPQTDLLLAERLPPELLPMFDRRITLSHCLETLLLLPRGPSRTVWRETVRDIVPRQSFSDQWCAVVDFAERPDLSIGQAEQLLSCLQQLLEEASRPGKADPDGGVGCAPLDSNEVDALLELPSRALNAERLNPTDAALSRLALNRSLQVIGRWLARNRSTVEMNPEGWMKWAALNDTEGRRTATTAKLVDLAVRDPLDDSDLEQVLGAVFELRDTMSGNARFRLTEVRALLGIHNRLLSTRYPRHQEMHRAAIAGLRNLLRFVRTGNRHLPPELIDRVGQEVLDREPTEAELGY